MNKKEINKTFDEIIKYLELFRTVNNQDFETNSIYFTNEIKRAVSNTSEAEALKILNDNKSRIYAIAISAIERVTNKTLRPPQILSGLYLDEKNIVEMKTGEGKTLSIVAPAYFNALTNKSVHIATTNEYLAERDWNETKEIFRLLGLTSSYVIPGIKTNIKAQQEAYNSNITYASISTLAFHNMYDRITDESEEIVNKNPLNYLIVDEADDVMIDTALTPFIISGNYNSEKKIYGEEYLNNYNHKKNEKIYNEAKKVDSYIREIIKNYRAYRAFNQEDFNYLVSQKSGNTLLRINGKDRQQKLQEYGIIIDPDYRNFHLTDIAGHVFSYPNLNQEADRLSNKKLDLRGYCELIESNKYPELTKSAMKIETEFLKKHAAAVNNALIAYCTLIKGRDYVYNEKNHKIELIISGRKEESRSYSNNLQLAVELKERNFLGDDKVKITKDNPKIDQMTMIGFLSKYSKVAGITGTSNEDSFKTLYNLETKYIEPYREYLKSQGKYYPGLEELDSYICPDENNRNHLMLNIAKETMTKQQPLMIVTNSVSESEKIKKLIEKELNHTVVLLNANTENEALAISKAGTKGQITVCTKIAGRGTDIKLGSSLEDDLNIKINKQIEEIIEDYYLPKTPEQIKTLYQTVKNKYEKQFIQELKNNNYEKEHNDINSLGGLKIVQLGHFPTKREDEQLIGRCARGLDRGQYQNLSTVEDLKKIGVTINIHKTTPADKYKKIILNQQDINEAQKANTIYFQNNQNYLIGRITDKIIENHNMYRNMDINNMDNVFRNIVNKIDDITEEDLTQLGISNPYNTKELKSLIFKKYNYLKDSHNKNEFFKDFKNACIYHNLDMRDQFEEVSDILKTHNDLVSYSFKSIEDKNSSLVESLYQTIESLNQGNAFNTVRTILNPDYNKKDRGKDETYRQTKKIF